MSVILEKQKLFTRLLPRLIDFIHESGYECVQGDAFRDPRVFGEIGVSKGYGHPNSNHKRRLAKDLYLFRGDEFLTRTEDYQLIGEFWESLNPLCRWGGRFSDPDGNHFSIEHEGQR